MFFVHCTNLWVLSESGQIYNHRLSTLPKKKSSVNFHSTFIFKAEIQTKNKTTDVKVYEL